MKHYLIILLMLLLMSCSNEGKNEQESSTPVTVETQVVSVTALEKELTLSGNVEGATTVRLGFLVPGKISHISKKEGELIRKGELLSSLDATNYSIAKQLADVQLNATDDEYNRLKIMYDRKSISESDFKKIGFSLQEAQLQQKLHTKNLNDTRLYSPIEGVLLSKKVEVGEIVNQGMPLFVVADIRKVFVSVFVPEDELNKIRLNQEASIFIAAQDKAYSGKITEVGALADPASRAFAVKIEVVNDNLSIRPGMIAEARIPSRQPNNAMLLPAGCIGHDPDGQSYVYVADEKTMQAFKRKVNLGGIMENKIEITSGLSEGEVVVASGLKKLSDGSYISTVK